MNQGSRQARSSPRERERAESARRAPRGAAVSGVGRRVRVKICGVTTLADGRLAAAAGADAVGLNFHRPSPRCLSPQAAAAIVRGLPPFVATVGVFVDPSPEYVAAVLAAVPLASLQFHGGEPAALCRRFARPYIKALRVGADFRFGPLSRRYPDAQALLLDTWTAGRAGGTGESFDWARWPRSRRALILAGGLRPDNVAAAVAATRPYAVDVASGVEGAVPGRKARDKMARFIAAVGDA